MISEVYNCVVPEYVDIPPPELNLIDTEGAQVALADHNGNVVLVNVWASWCPPCKTEMPDLQKFYELRSDEGFIIIGVNIGESLDRGLKFSELLNISFPIWLDPDEMTLRMMNKTAMPSSFVLERSGKVRLAWSGLSCLSALDSTVTPIIEE